MTNIHNERVKKLLSSNNQEEVIDEMRDYFNMSMKFDACYKNIVKYENTMQKAMELIIGLYDEDLVAELLIAPTQFGKTSTVFWTAHNLMTHIDMKYFVPYPFVFIMTGLNSNSWKEQTTERVLDCMKENVWHNKDILKEENKKRLKDAVLSDYNTLIIIDEVHVGTKLDHVIFNTLLEFHPENSLRDVSQIELFEFLHSKRVKFLLVSATPDAIKETMEQNWKPEQYDIIVAHPDSAPTYVWHKDFLNKGRVHQAYGIKEKTGDGIPFHKVITQRISEYSRPLYHMIRFPMDTKKAEIATSKEILENYIKKKNINARIVLWDANNTTAKYFKDNDYDVFEDKEITPSEMKKMSNEDILRKKPVCHTIFILKELFRVAQTMPIDNIGILVDRDTKTPCDSTLSQSLIGRACGHNKQKFIAQILIYTNVQSVINYIKLWENNFDYAKAPGYIGNGVKTTKNGTFIKAEKTMLGDKVKRSAEWNETESESDKNKNKEDDQEDTPERLALIAKKYERKNGLVRQIIEMFRENNFQPVQNLKTKNHDNYDRYMKEHGKVRIIQKVNGFWMLRSEIREYLKL